jgi:conjugal transfer pilus assembly protein TraE
MQGSIEGQGNIEDKERGIGIIRQRNFFVGCTALVVAANFLLALKISTTAEKIIMVPGISREMTVAGSAVSQSYLEETSLLFASALLDLTPDTIDAKKNIILKHVSSSSGESLKLLQQYFADRAEEHKKFRLASFFAPQKMSVDSKNLRVIIEGVLTSSFGQRGFEQKNVKYLLSFDYAAGRLRLKEFTQIKPEDTSRERDPKKENPKKH